MAKLTYFHSVPYIYLKSGYKNVGLDMCLTSRRLISRLDPLFLVKTICFQLKLEMEVLKPCKPTILNRNCRRTFMANKRGTNLETKLLEVRHMSRRRFFYLGLPNSILKPMFSNVCGLHMRAMKEPIYNGQCDGGSDHRPAVPHYFGRIVKL